MAEDMFNEIIVGDETLKAPYWLALKDTNKLSPDTIKAAIKAVQEWDQKFAFPWRLEIQGIDPEVRNIPGGGSVTVRESAHHGWIGLSDHASAYSTVLHAMTHAYRPTNQETLSTPLKFQGKEIFGYLGLFVGYKDEDGQTQTFKLFEESVAERNTVVIFPNHFPPNSAYFGTSLLTLARFPVNTESVAPQDFIITNDVPGFVRQFLNIPIEKPVTAKDIFYLIDLYTEVARKSDEINEPYKIKEAFNNRTLIPTNLRQSK